jgi:hypothetical protein
MRLLDKIFNAFAVDVEAIVETDEFEQEKPAAIREFGPMGCVKKAFRDAGIDARDIPSHAIDKRAMPAIAERYGLTFHGEGRLSMDKGRPIIVMYETRPGHAHAEYLDDPSMLDNNPALKTKIIGIVTGFISRR